MENFLDNIFLLEDRHPAAVDGCAHEEDTSWKKTEERFQLARENGGHKAAVQREQCTKAWKSPGL